jgi:hypothetical protein
VIPTCPICDAQDADIIPDERGYTRPWGKPYFCKVCSFVYCGSQDERIHWETRQQRLRHRNSRQAADRNWNIGAALMNAQHAGVGPHRLEPVNEGSRTAWVPDETGEQK